MNQRIFSVRWRGPFTLKELDELVESGVIYLVTGRKSAQKRDLIQYCGITEQSICYRKIRHRKISRITTNREIWIGWLDSCRTTRPSLESAEKLLIYGLQPPLNQRKHRSQPKPASLISRWFEPGPMSSRGVPEWIPKEKPATFRRLHDLICWDGSYFRTGSLGRRRTVLTVNQQNSLG